MAEGTFLLADISGYSRYLDEAGLAHASNITAKLLNSLIDANSKRWNVANLEGDAVFLVHAGRVPPGELVAFVRELYQAFFDRVLDVSQDTDCGCGACGGANRLTVKFMVHAGRYEDRAIGGRRELIGPDVVIVHRLLKPEVDLPEYLLLTREYLRDAAIRELPTSEGVLQLDRPVPFVVADLAPIRAAAEARHAAFIERRRALRRAEVQVTADPDRVWDALLDPAQQRRWTGASEVSHFPSRPGSVGTSYRWSLPDGHAFGQLLIAIDPDRRRLTFRRADLPAVRYVYTTYEVDRQGGGSAVACSVSVARRMPFSGRLLAGLERRHPAIASGAALDRLKSHCERS
jgi:hypothetical protein